MPMMKFAYQNAGGPMSWKDGPPSQMTGGGDKRALGDVARRRVVRAKSARHTFGSLSGTGAMQELGSLGGGPVMQELGGGPAMQELGNTLVLPAPGAPEPLNGCSCAGSCGCGTSSPAPALSGITDTIAAHPVLSIAGAYLFYRWFIKK